jgi:hypothetical protein
MSMFPGRTKDRKAISAVLTTIVILVASIVLGAGVVVFSTGLFQTGGQQQAASMQGLKAWVNATNATGVSWGAFAVKNTGDKLLSISSITLRSVNVPFTNWFADTDPTRVSQNFQAQFNYTGTDKSGFVRGTKAASPGYTLSTWTGSNDASCITGQVPGSNTQIVIQEVYNSATTSPVCLLQQSGPISLSPGSSAIIYFKDPAGLFGTTDSGVTSTVSVLAGSAPISQTVRLANN